MILLEQPIGIGLTLYLFWEKILCKNSFSCFTVFDSIEKKNSQWNTIFSQHKKYDLFLEIV